MMSPTRRVIVAVYLLCVTAVCAWVPWKARVPEGDIRGDFYLGYDFWWSPPEPPPNYVKLALDREVLCEVQAVTAPATNLRSPPANRKLSEEVAEFRAELRSGRGASLSMCSIERLGDIGPFLQRLPLSTEAKEAVWTAFYRAGSPSELDAALAKLPLRTEDKETLGRARWKLTTLKEAELKEAEQFSKNRSDVEAMDSALESIVRRREPIPPAEEWKGDRLLAHLKKPSHFRILLPELAGIEDAELRRNLERYERDTARGIPPQAYRFSRIDVTAIALEIVALTALAGLGFVLSGRGAIPRNTPKGYGGERRRGLQMKNEDTRLSSLLAYAQADGRICPQPRRWNELWELLPNKKRVGGGWNPPLPLILAAWHDTTGLEKMLRLRSHIEYAWENSAFEAVDAFLRALPEDDWHRGSGG